MGALEDVELTDSRLLLLLLPFSLRTDATDAPLSIAARLLLLLLLILLNDIASSKLLLTFKLRMCC